MFWNRRTRLSKSHPNKIPRPLSAKPSHQADSESEIASVKEESSATTESTPPTSIQLTDAESDKGSRKDHFSKSSDVLMVHSSSIPDWTHTISAHHSDTGSDKGSLDEGDWLIDRSLMAHIEAQHADAEDSMTPLDQTDAIPVPMSSEAILHSHSGGDASDRIVCGACLKDSPELCCLKCDSDGTLYHEGCWATEPSHKSTRDIHRPIPTTCLPRLRYLKEPNKQSSIKASKFQADDSNCLIKFDIKSRQFQFGHRAFPLLRHGCAEDFVQYPSFVSFVGRTMNGKSFLIRALQYTGEAHNLPTPIPAPGANPHNHDSTSSDIHLYPDSTTSRDESPILFLDCEGFEGSDVPRSLREKLTSSTEAAERRSFVEVAYPRLIYAFSTCVVFVTALAGADDIKRRLISYASQGASGSKNQGFKPSLFVVFNRFRGGNKPGFDWSINSSSEAFLADKNRRAELEQFYSNIRVVCIPSMDRAEAAIALQQIDAFVQNLRQEHKVAFLRRRKFCLNFTSAQLTPYLRRALSHFSKDSNSPFDWASEAPLLGFTSDTSDAMLIDLWMQYIRYHTTPNSPQMPYGLVRNDFEKHVMLCLRLELKRHPQPGLEYTRVPPNWAKKMQQLCFDYTPCGASLARLKCEKVRLRHGDHHQSLYIQGLPVIRWSGDYEPCGYTISQTFQKSFEVALQESPMAEVSLNDFRILPKDVRSIVSCLGCLQRPPSTILACGHAFCSDCIRELTHLDPSPHQLESIRCPIHQEKQEFSPRLLPIQSGCRILCLDGGGVKGLAQLIMLNHIEKKSFGIPLMHLFDLIMGTSVGGQIALALTCPTHSGPLTATAATEEFRALIKSAFERKSWSIPIAHLFMDKTKYKTSTLERHLKKLFGTNEKLFSAVASSPNIAVTTVVLQPYKAHLITNYNRKPSADALPLLFGSTANDCIPIWAAARSTSAAVPYFKQLEWQGQILLDGGFKLNCPAACAYSEAKCIWPDKCCDILLSLGTGRATDHQLPPVKNKFFRVARAVADDMANAEDAWIKFETEVLQDNIFRLNPTYNGTGFQLDECEKLDEIETQVEKWIVTQNSQLTRICHQLIAALFFFRLLPPEDGVQAGEIVCRLPVGLQERQKLIEHMLLEEDLKLFVVECNGRSDETCFVNIPLALQNLNVTDELRLRVEPLNLSATGEMKIHVKMRGLATLQPGDIPQWFPISGSPYAIQQF